MISTSLSNPFPSDNVDGASSVPLPDSATDTTGQIDTREALFNDGATGRIQEIQVSTDRIVALRGILFDVDPDLLTSGGLIAPASDRIGRFYEENVIRWLSRHPVLKKAQVRATGTGLHVLLLFDQPVSFDTDSKRQRWCSLVKAVQATLPTDPHAPGITATTRPVGSINSKSDRTVELIEEGTPVTATEVEQLGQEMCEKPFRTLFHTLTGDTQACPCPSCRSEGSSLAAFDHVGKCYKCGTVKFDQLCNLIFKPVQAGKGA